MGLRFRKYITLAPGIRMNFTKSGASWTIGPRGASIGIGKRGAYLNTGIPGTGIYSRERIGAPTPAARNSIPSGSGDMLVKTSINDDGELSFTDAQGNPLPVAYVNAAKKQQGDKIKELIQTKCDEINAQVEALGEIHVHTPPPLPLTFTKESFCLPKPTQPQLKEPGFWCRIFKSLGEQVEAANAAIIKEHQSRVEAWEKEKASHDSLQAERSHLIDLVNAGDEKAMEQYLVSVLQDIVWPRETLVSFDLKPGGVIAFDVDLPEIEEMPTTTAAVPQRGWKLSVKEMGSTKVQKLYMRHVHAVGFRLIGEAFASLPTVQNVALSAYSQRPSKATAQIEDEYLYSIRVSRGNWSKINFSNLAQIDAVESFNNFEMRREMSKTGVFKSIEPFSI